MKLYAVKVERPGKTIKEPGIVETELKVEQFMFAAASIGQVWDAIEFIRSDPEATLIGLWEQYPAVQVLGDAAEPSSKEGA